MVMPRAGTGARAGGLAGVVSWRADRHGHARPVPATRPSVPAARGPGPGVLAGRGPRSAGGLPGIGEAGWCHAITWQGEGHR
jgi:hypothetical protein